MQHDIKSTSHDKERSENPLPVTLTSHIIHLCTAHTLLIASHTISQLASYVLEPVSVLFPFVIAMPRRLLLYAQLALFGLVAPPCELMQ